MTLLEFFYLSWATYYLAHAFVDVAWQIVIWNDRRNVTVKDGWQWQIFKWFYKKPFNCVLCMAGYSSIILFALAQFISVAFIIIPAAAGVALLLSKIQQKLETFIID